MKCIVLKPSCIQGFLCNFKIERDISISFGKKWSWPPCRLLLNQHPRQIQTSLWYRNLAQAKTCDSFKKRIKKYKLSPPKSSKSIFSPLNLEQLPAPLYWIIRVINRKLILKYCLKVSESFQRYGNSKVTIVKRKFRVYHTLCFRFLIDYFSAGLTPGADALGLQNFKFFRREQ